MESEPAQPIDPVLHWQDAQGRAQVFVLKMGETLVGRASDCDLVIPHSSVSRQHAKILGYQGLYFLIDLGTIFGTFVNGMSIGVCALRSGDHIEFGGAQNAMYFGLDAPEPAHQAETHDGRAPEVKLRPSDVLPEAASSILHAELRKIRGHRMGLERELLLAQRIQEALLPKELPDIDGFRLRAYSRPTRYVGGDFYDFIPTPAPGICGVLGDVSGKGVAASLLSAMVVGCLDARLRTGSSLEDAVHTLNWLLCEKGGERFATLFLFRFQSNGHGQFVSAGHNPAYVYRHEGGEVLEVSSNNIIVGPFSSFSFQPGSIDLAPGDLMLIYSDGLTEAEGLDGNMLGEEPVRRLLQQHSRAGADDVKTSLLELLNTFTADQEQNDDITFIILQRL